ncbi:SPOSA6832_03977, partial [Sporobolomyces salmonicolor]
GALAVLAAVLAAAPAPADAITIPLSRRDLGIKQADGSVSFSALQEEASRLSTTGRRCDSTWRTVGIRAQSFNIYFDTGSSDFTVASTSCTTSCDTKNRYNVGASSTAYKTSTTVTTNFVDGTASSGTLVNDVVSAAGLTATNQSVIAATSLSSSVSSIDSDGMGLAWPALSQAFSTALPFTLYNQGQGSQPWFGLRLSNTPGVSQLTFGGYNRARVNGSPRWLSITKDSGDTFNTYWQVGGSAPYVNGAQAITTRVNHIFDSGTTLIVAPPTAAAQFWASVPGSAQYDDNFYTYPCDSPPTVEFSFARITLQKYGISSDDFNLGYLSENQTHWYMVHDVKNARVGFGSPR